MAITNATIAQQVADLIEHWDGFNQEYADWLGGSVSGGPSSDGAYPMTDYSGNVSLVDSPAKLADSVNSVVTGAAAHKTAAQAAETAAVSAKDDAVLAETGAQTAETSSIAARDAALAAQSAAETARATAIAQAAAALTSANNAATSETNAAGSATAAAASATAADSSATDAAASAAAAATFDPVLYAALADNETITGEYTFQNNATFSQGTGVSLELKTDIANLALIRPNGDFSADLGFDVPNDRWFVDTDLSIAGEVFGSNTHAKLADNETITGSWAYSSVLSITRATANDLLNLKDSTSGNEIRFRTTGSTVKLIPRDGVTGYVFDRELYFDFTGNRWVFEGDASIDGRTYSSAKFDNWDTAYSWGDHASGGYASLTGQQTFADSIITDGLYAGGNDNQPTSGHYARLVTTSSIGYLDSRDFSTSTWKDMRYRASSHTFENGNINLLGGIGLDIAGLDAMRHSGNWLYLNGAGEFTSGVYVGSFLNVGTGIQTDSGYYYGPGGVEMVRGADTYLRLNQANQFANGVYTPYDMRVDGTLLVGTSGAYIVNPSTHNTSGMSYVQKKTGPTSITAGQWITLATNPSGLDITAAPPAVGGSRAAARFILADLTSGRHEYYFVTAMVHYGNQPYLKVEGAHYGSQVFSKFRIVEGTTYDGAALQVYVEATLTATWYVSMLENFQSPGWTLVNPVAETPHASWTTSCEVNSSGWGFAFAGDHGLSVNNLGTLTIKNNGEDVVLQANSDTYGALSIDSVKGGYNGISFSAANVAGSNVGVLMSQGSNFGLYNDTSNQWLAQGAFGGAFNMYHSGSLKIATHASGIMVTGSAYLNDTNTRLMEGTGNSLRVQTNSGYVDLGAQNTSYCHFNTDRAAVYMGQRLEVNGDICDYNAGSRRPYLHLTNTGMTSGGNVTISTSAPSGGADGDIWLEY